MGKIMALSQQTVEGFVVLFFFNQFVHLLEMMFKEDQSGANSGLC